MAHAQVILASMLSLSALAALALPEGNVPQADVPIPPAAARQIRDLWDLRAARAVPFDIEVLSTRTEDGYCTDEMYLTSRMTPDGPDRLFCTFARLVSATPLQPAYIDLTGGRDVAGVTWLARHYRCAVLDIEWRSPDLKHHTKWARPSPNGLFGLNPNLTDDFNCMFVTGIRRAIDFLETQPGIDQSKIACGGGSMGGWYSLLVAGIDRRVACVHDAWAAGRDVARTVQTLPPDKCALWRAAFDPLSYAGRVRAATLMYLGTNDFFFPPDNGMAHYNRLRSEKRVLLVPNCNHGFGPFGVALPEVDRNWIDHCFHGSPGFPAVSDPVARGRAYRWRVTGPASAKSSTLYWSPGNPIWQARYWIGIPAARHGEEWTAEIPTQYAGLAAVVYASAFDERGSGASSRIVSRKGTDPTTTAGPMWPGNALWDIERGAAAWRRPGPAAENAFWTEEVTVAAPSGISVTPTDPAGKVSLLTNSVILASGRAAEYSGIRLVIDGQGASGELTVSLERDSGVQTRVAHRAYIHYGSGRATVSIPWSEFQAAGAAPSAPYPFDGLRLDGDRETGRTLRIESLELGGEAHH